MESRYTGMISSDIMILTRMDIQFAQTAKSRRPGYLVNLPILVGLVFLVVLVILCQSIQTSRPSQSNYTGLVFLVILDGLFGISILESYSRYPV